MASKTTNLGLEAAKHCTAYRSHKTDKLSRFFVKVANHLKK
jgi:hypothetical protein